MLITVAIVNIDEAKSSFGRLIAAAEAGEAVIIARNGKPVAQLGPMPKRTPIVLGDLAGQSYSIADDFADWTDADEQMWFGDPDSPLAT